MVPHYELVNYGPREMEMAKDAGFKRACFGCKGHQVLYSNPQRWECIGQFKKQTVVIPAGEKPHEVEQRFIKLIRVADPCEWASLDENENIIEGDE